MTRRIPLCIWTCTVMGPRPKSIFCSTNSDVMSRLPRSSSAKKCRAASEGHSPPCNAVEMSALPALRALAATAERKFTAAARKRFASDAFNKKPLLSRDNFARYLGFCAPTHA